MKLSKSLLVIPAASILLAAAIGSGACSSSVSIIIPTAGTVPPNDTFQDGYAVGGTCDGDVYVTGSTGFLFCDSGVWAYTDSVDGDGFTEDTGGSDGTSDTGTSDTGTSDTGTSDTGTSDTGTSDTGTSDTGTSDTGTSDTGTSDTGTSDTGGSSGS